MVKNNSPEDADNLFAYELALDYTVKALDEAYRWEKSISEGVVLQNAIFSFLITGIISLEIGLYNGKFALFPLTLALSILTISTMLVSILLAIISQWRMKRISFPESGKIIDAINKASIKGQPDRGYNRIIGVFQSTEDSINNNNRKRTKVLHAAHVIAIISIGEMLVSIVLVCVILLLNTCNAITIT